MTDEETIKIIENMKIHAERTDDTELINACETAIKAIEDRARLKDNIQWLIDQYQHNVETIQEDLRENGFQMINHGYLTGKLGVYAKAVKDLEDLLNADE